MKRNGSAYIIELLLAFLVVTLLLTACGGNQNDENSAGVEPPVSDSEEITTETPLGNDTESESAKDQEEDSSIDPFQADDTAEDLFPVK